MNEIVCECKFVGKIKDVSVSGSYETAFTKVEDVDGEPFRIATRWHGSCQTDDPNNILSDISEPVELTAKKISVCQKCYPESLTISDPQVDSEDTTGMILITKKSTNYIEFEGIINRG